MGSLGLTCDQVKINFPVGMTEKWPFFAYDDRKEAVLALDGYKRQHFFSVGNQKILFHNFNTATHGAHKN
jgi:hypothetical protein